ncbi:transferase, partial [Streptomyces sp. me109]
DQTGVPSAARLRPPYARAADGTPVWSHDLPQVTLDHLLLRPARVLPAAVDAELRPRARAALLRLRLHDLYGRIAQAGPASADVTFSHRVEGRTAPSLRVALAPDPDRSGWSAETPVNLSALGHGTWDLRLRLHFRDGTHRDVSAHAVGGPGLLRRHAVLDSRHGVLLVQPYRTHAGSLALRLAPGWRGVTEVARRRLGRLLP